MQVEAKPYGRGKERKGVTEAVGKLVIVACTPDDAAALAEFASVLLDHRGRYKDLLRRISNREKEKP